MAWDADQKHNAQVIIAVGKQLGASARDIQIALMVALTESKLHNVNYGDRDSLGLFQQRSAWGSVQQRMDPAASARMFFLGGHQGQRGLFDFKNRNQMSLGEAAQAVQVSAFPDRYAEYQTGAASLLQHLGDVKGIPGTLGAVPGVPEENPGPSISEALQSTLGDFNSGTGIPETSPLGEVSSAALDSASSNALGEEVNPALGTQQFGEPIFATSNPLSDMKIPTLDQIGVKWDGADVGGEGWRNKVAKYAHNFLGTPYVWGGTNPNGFDCSGLVQYVFKHVGIDLPRLSYDQANYGHHVKLGDLKPGDLVAWDNSSERAGADHIALYIGNGKIIEAPRPGLSVQVSNLYDTGEAWGVRMHR